MSMDDIASTQMMLFMLAITSSEASSITLPAYFLFVYSEGLNEFQIERWQKDGNDKKNERKKKTKTHSGLSFGINWNHWAISAICIFVCSGFSCTQLPNNMRFNNIKLVIYAEDTCKGINVWTRGHRCFLDGVRTPCSWEDIRAAFCLNASNDLCLHFPNRWPFVSWVTRLCHKQQWKDGRFDNATTLRKEVVLNTKWQNVTLHHVSGVCFVFSASSCSHSPTSAAIP